MNNAKKAKYRLRVYQLADGSIDLVFGDDAPDNPLPIDPATNATPKILCDHDVVETATWTNHVES